jgi:transcriptional pleiotropic regulator of transition state genes
MKYFGIVCKMSKAGEVRLPGILRGICEVGVGDELEMNLEGNAVVMKKYPPVCIFCGSKEDLKEYRHKNYCCCCADELKNLKGI